MDIATRAAKLCAKLHIVVLINPAKRAAFSEDERVNMARLCLAQYDNIEVSSYNGLLVDFMRDRGLRVVVRGLRSESDFRFETELAATNILMYPDYETILLPSKTDYSFTSSSIVREVASYGGDISRMVPLEILELIQAHFAGQTRQDK